MKLGVLTVDDRAWMQVSTDETGPAVKARLEAKGWTVPLLEVIPSERDGIAKRLKFLADSGDYACLITTGGAGTGPREWTPEATAAVIERPMPGLQELIRGAGACSTPLMAVHRGVAGICGSTLIVNLPGTPAGAVEALDAILELIQPIVRAMRP